VDDLIRQVRSALAHIYDHAYLQNHPLARLVDTDWTLDQVTRAQRLRRKLLGCIEALHPQGQEQAPSDATRAHAILTYRYVDGISMEEIAERRGLSVRQAYRELEKGVQAVASLLRDQLGGRDPAGPAGPALADAPTNQALQLAQLEVARLEQAVNVETLDLWELLQGILRSLAPLCERAGSRIALALPDPWPPVLADRALLRLALLNLLTHALSSAARGDLAIALVEGQGYQQIEISEVAAPTRAQPCPPPSAERPPVGLAVARSLLAAQGGRLDLGQRDGRWLARVGLRTARAATILVIDDNQDLVALLQRYLAGHDVQVVGASSGAQALRLAQEVSPQLITLDVMMPGQDGWEVLQQLRASPGMRDTPIVICSVLHEHELAQTMGASDYITKPVVQAELVRVLTHWLGPLRPST